jgi:hypothetical protein
MNTTTLKAAAYYLIGGALFLSAGCSDNNASSGSVPDNAILITSSNATTTVATAVSSSNVALSEVPAGVEVTQAPSVLNILKSVRSMVVNQPWTSMLSTSTGIMESDQCDSGNGSFSNTYNNPTSTSITGSISFTGCTRAGQTLNGQLSYSLDWTDPSGPYTTNITGNVTAEYNNNMTAIGNLNYTVTGNNATGDFTVNPFTHTVDYSGGHGFAVSLPDPVMGNVNTDDQCPLSGTVLVTGANGTQVKAAIDYPNINIEVNDGSGTFTPVGAVPCTDIFPVNRPFMLRYI